MRVASFVVAGALAMPALAQAPTFLIGVQCDGPVPLAIIVQANEPGAVRVTLERMIAECMRHADEPKPTPQKWRAT
jgi:redox-regulated HSP33 family molecular chaperone